MEKRKVASQLLPNGPTLILLRYSINKWLFKFPLVTHQNIQFVLGIVLLPLLYFIFSQTNLSISTIFPTIFYISLVIKTFLSISRHAPSSLLIWLICISIYSCTIIFWEFSAIEENIRMQDYWNFAEVKKVRLIMLIRIDSLFHA